MSASRPHFTDLGDSISPLARLAAIVAVTGHHAMLLVGHPGVGKTMLARRAVAVLPDLVGPVADEHRAMLELHRGSAEHYAGPMRPPFRAPHHTASVAGMGGARPGRERDLPPGESGPRFRSPARPGECALAHGGLLFLDDAPEFSRAVLDTVATVRREGRVELYGSDGMVAARWPAVFGLLATCMPCPCGFWGHPVRACIDPPSSAARYFARLAGLRFDIVVAASQPPDALDPRLGMASDETIAGAVAAARRELARLGRRSTVHETLRALGYLDPDPLARALCGPAHTLAMAIRAGEPLQIGGAS